LKLINGATKNNVGLFPIRNDKCSILLKLLNNGGAYEVFQFRFINFASKILDIDMFKTGILNRAEMIRCAS